MAKADPSDLLAEPLRWATQRALNDTAKVWAAAGQPLAAYLAALVAELVRPGQAWRQVISPMQMMAIRGGVDPGILGDAMVEAFDADNYFGGSPKSVAEAALNEMVGDRSRALKYNAADAKLIASGDALRTGWLPEQLRTPAYIGPGSKAAKGTRR